MFIFMHFLLLMLNKGLIAKPALNFITSQDFSHGTIASLDWHLVTSSETSFIAYVGNNHGNDDIRVARLDDGCTELDVVAKSNLEGPNGWANATAWTDGGPRHLAVGGFNNNQGHEIRIYSYNQGHIEQERAEDMPEVLTLDWLRADGTSYLAVGGFDNNNGREVRIYEYNDNNIMTLRSTATFFHGKANSVQWFINDDTIYLAVAGFEIGDSIDNNVRIYSFDKTTKILTLVTTKSFDFFPSYSVSWITNGTNIYVASCGYDGGNTSQIRVFSFNGSSLTYVNTQGFNFGTVYASDWIFYNSVMYLAVAGDDAENGREVRVYSFDGTTLTPTPVAAGDDPENGREVGGYSFDGKTLTPPLVSLDFGFAVPHTLEWQLVGDIPYLAIGCNDDPAALQLYSFSV